MDGIAIRAAHEPGQDQHIGRAARTPRAVALRTPQGICRATVLSLAAVTALLTSSPGATAQVAALPPGIGIESRVDSDAPGLHSSMRPQVVITDTERVHTVWLDYRDPTWAIYTRTLTDLGTTPIGPEVRLSGTGNAAPPKLASDGADAVYAVWHEFEGDFERVVFARSIDDGVTWSGPVPLSNISGYVSNPEISADASGRVYVAWAQFDGPQDQIYLRSSLDYGATWSTSQHVNSTSIGHSETPRLAHDGNGTAYIAYIDRRLGEHDVFLRRYSTITGFGPDVHIDKSDVTTTSLAMTADAGGGSGLVLVAWIDLDIAGSVGLETCLNSNWSLDGGVTWQPTDTPLSAICSEPDVTPLFLDFDLAAVHDSVSGETRVHAAYGRIEIPASGPPTPTGVYHNTFVTGGLTTGWDVESKLSVGGAPYPSKGPVFTLPRAAIAVSPDDPERIFVTWMHVEEGWESYYDVLATWSTDGGTNFGVAQSVTGKPDGPGSSRSAFPQIAAMAKHAVIVWDDRRAWTRPSLLPPGDPYTNGTSPPLGSPDVYLNTVVTQP